MTLCNRAAMPSCGALKAFLPSGRMPLIVVMITEGSNASDIAVKVQCWWWPKLWIICSRARLPNLGLKLRNCSEGIRGILLAMTIPSNMQSRRSRKPSASPFLPPPSKPKDINLIDNVDELLDLLRRTNEQLNRYVLTISLSAPTK